MNLNNAWLRQQEDEVLEKNCLKFSKPYIKGLTNGLKI